MIQFDTMAICLKSTPYRETDQIASFYSPDHGELRAIVKGVKKPTSKLAGSCEALTLNHLFLAQGRNLHTVCHYERIDSFQALRSDLERLAVGSVCTDILRLLGRENDPDSPAVYELLSTTLSQLNDTTQSWVPPSLLFHESMLSLSGYLPSFSSCLFCDNLLDLDHTTHHPFFVTAGGFVCDHCMHQHHELDRVNVSTTTLKLFSNPHNTNLYTHTVRAHRFLAYFWAHRLERPVKSFDFLFELLDTNRPIVAVPS